MDSEPNEPWKLATNDKYYDVVKTIMGLSTASLLLPVFLARNFLNLEQSTPLTEVLGCSIYWAWFLFAASILAGIFFQYLSAKWMRTAWGKKTGIFFSENTKESTIERYMNGSFWLCVLMFFLGLILTVVFFVNYGHGA